MFHISCPFGLAVISSDLYRCTWCSCDITKAGCLGNLSHSPPMADQCHLFSVSQQMYRYHACISLEWISRVAYAFGPSCHFAYPSSGYPNHGYFEFDPVLNTVRLVWRSCSILIEALLEQVRNLTLKVCTHRRCLRLFKIVHHGVLRRRTQRSTKERR